MRKFVQYSREESENDIRRTWTFDSWFGSFVAAFIVLCAIVGIPAVIALVWATIRVLWKMGGAS